MVFPPPPPPHCRDNAKVKTSLISTAIPRPPPGVEGPWLQMTSAIEDQIRRMLIYRKVPKFSVAKKVCCNRNKIQTKRTNLRVFCRKDDRGIVNSEDPDQTAPLGAV